MRFQIMHEGAGRVRLRALQGEMSVRGIDMDMDNIGFM